MQLDATLREVAARRAAELRAEAAYHDRCAASLRARAESVERTWNLSAETLDSDGEGG